MYVIFILFLGVICGYFMPYLQSTGLNKAINLAIFLLVLLLGVAVGANSAIMNNLGTIGLKGLLIGLASLMGSVLLVWVISSSKKWNKT